MEALNNKTTPKQRMSRLSCLSFLSWITAAIVGCVSFYLDRYAPYREMGGYPKDKIENELLLLAMLLALTGIIIAISALVSIQKSRDAVKGNSLAIIGIVLNLITIVVCGFELFFKLWAASIP